MVKIFLFKTLSVFAGCIMLPLFRLSLPTAAAEAALSSGDAKQNGAVRSGDTPQEKLRKALNLKRADSVSYDSPAPNIKLMPRDENPMEDELSSCFSNLNIRSPTSPTFENSNFDSFKSPLPKDQCKLNKFVYL